MSRRKQMSPRSSPHKLGPFYAPYEHRPYRGGDPYVPKNDDYDDASFLRSSSSLRKNEGDDCTQKIADLHASSQILVEKYTKKLDVLCDQRLIDELTQKKADMIIIKNQNIDQFKEKLKEHIKDQQTLCDLDLKLQSAKESLDNMIKRGGDLSSVDNPQIIKLKNEVQSLEKDVSALKSTIAVNASKITEQEPDLNTNQTGSACCIM